MPSRKALIVAASLFAVGCAPTPPVAPAGSAALVGSKWQLVSFQSSDDTIGTIRPMMADQYTIEFLPEGQVAMKLDCNRGSGSWASTGESNLTFSPMATTRAACPPEPFSNRLPRDFENVRSYVLNGDVLSLALFADGGIYTYQRMR
ncbi:MAG: META domain-containing protein [Sphingomonadaceae bacterium]